MQHYLEEIELYRKNVPPEDVNLETLRNLFFAFLGVKGKSDDDKDIDIKNLPKVKASTEEIDAWLKSGCKGTYPNFVAQYRKEKKK